MLLTQTDSASVHCCDWRDLVPIVEAAGGCSLLCVDAPYSEKTHNGHGTMERWGTSTPPCYDGGERREIRYQHWTGLDVRGFVAAWHPLTRGWFVSITDDQLAPVWSAALEAVGRYAFAWLPYVAPGSRVRLSGDGPSSWTTWIVVARPRTREMAQWGTLPGAYVLPEGQGGALPVVGGKPIWLMQRLVEDYSRPGELVCDPCMGAGTTLVGALRSGRRAIGGDILPLHADLAALWVRHPERPAPSIEKAPNERQPSLFAGDRP